MQIIMRIQEAIIGKASADECRKISTGPGMINPIL
jgi:hypothetical protein